MDSGQGMTTTKTARYMATAPRAIGMAAAWASSWRDTSDPAAAKMTA